MTLKKTHLLALATAAIVAGGILSTTKVSAQTDSADNYMSSLVQKIADRFGLNKDDVQAVFDEERKAHMQEMEATYEERLSQWVTDGKITEEQKNLILEKHKELLGNQEEMWHGMKDLTPEERRAKRDEKRAELENWAKENNIDLKYLMFFVKGQRGHGGKWNIKLPAPDSEIQSQ